MIERLPVIKRLSMLSRIEELSFVRAIRRGLILTIPLLMVGSFALIFDILPIGPYQDFLAGPGAFLNSFFTAVHEFSFGVLSLALTVSVSVSYARISQSQTALVIGAALSSLCAFSVLIGMFTEGFTIDSLGPQGMFTAMFSATVTSAVYCVLVQHKWFSFRFYTVGADIDFNNIVSVIFPVFFAVLPCYLLNLCITAVFNVSGFEALFQQSVAALFNLFSNGSLKALLYVVLACFMWFFGIHGTNVLNNAAHTSFGAGAALAGAMNKTAIDTFVFMGGCGTTICLLAAILLFGKKKNTRNLAKLAALPIFFNVNELLMFGLPVVFNAAFLIPFLLVPLVSLGATALAFATGIVPPPVNNVEWAAPLLVNGYQATGSLMGSLLQVFNIAVGVFIYRFFLLRYESREDARTKRTLGDLVGLMHKAEDAGETVVLLELKGNVGGLTKMLAADLEHTLNNPENLLLYYQPQYNEKNECIGAEALLRWNHPLCGMVYPPLVVGLAQETGHLGDLDRMIFRMACRDLQAMDDAYTCPVKVSVNATAATLQDPEFVVFLHELMEEFPIARNRLCIELTEQMSFILGAVEEELLNNIKAMGFIFAVDDFSMGHTSLKYLQSNLFSEVKLDGSLVKDMMDNTRSVEIISSIVHMAKTMDFHVLAEFVETADERDKLKELGCYLYQGWLYSPAIPLGAFIERVNEEKGGVCTITGSHH